MGRIATIPICKMPLHRIALLLDTSSKRVTIILMSNRRNFIKTVLAGGALSATGAASASSNESTPAIKKVERRTLGRTGADVSILGLGLGSSFYKTYLDDLETGHALLHRALDHGINYWDTCRGYGESEVMIAPVVEKNRDKIYLVTKSGQRDYDGFMREAEESLKRLGTDHLDLLHLWNLKPEDDLAAMEKGCFKAVTKLKDEGVIKHYGITGHSGARLLMDAIQRFDPDAILTVYPCTRDDEGRYEDELLPMARERNMGVIGMKVFRRARNADLKGSDMIRYALSLTGVHSVIVGLDTQGHLDENIQMASNFKMMPKYEQAKLHKEAVHSLRHIPTPWEHPDYVDGSLV